jgi:hypothetical protein
MSRRRSSGDQEFGSDSFLDIIANIVGILIILIVVAGLRVARQPAVAAPAESSTSAAAIGSEPASFDMVAAAVDKPDASIVNPVVPHIAVGTNTENPLLPPDPFPDEPARSDDVGQSAAVLETSDFDEQVRSLSLELTTAQANTATSETELQQLLVMLKLQRGNEQLQQTRLKGISQQRTDLTDSIAALTESVGAADGNVAAFESTLTSLNSRQTYVTDALKQIGQETQRLSEVLEAVEQQQSVADRLHHRLSPVGSAVTDGEVHFRLSGARIAHIPLEPLLDRLKTQVSARRSVVMRFHRYEGVVGPIGGFHMKYTVERQTVSPLQALQYGQNAYRVSVSRWSIQPTETLEAESVESALRVGSRMRQIMEATDPDTVITIWLYPDDFPHFGRIREFAHGLNLRVAARPLPDGTPIAGSPNGSRSTSQ